MPSHRVAEVPLLRFEVLTAAGSLLDGAMALIGYEVGGQWKSVMHGFSDAGYVLGALAVSPWPCSSYTVTVLQGGHRGSRRTLRRPPRRCQPRHPACPGAGSPNEEPEGSATE